MEQPSRPQQGGNPSNRGQKGMPSTTGKRNRRKEKGKRNNNGTSTTHQGSSFQGKYPEMNGHVFQCYEETSKRNQFEKTVEELGRYAATYLPYAKDIKMMLKSLREVVFPQPVDPPFSATRTTIRIWEKEVDLFMERKESYSENEWTIYAVIMGQCSSSLKTKLKGLDNFDTWDASHDVVKLLTKIKAISSRFDSKPTSWMHTYRPSHRSIHLNKWTAKTSPITTRDSQSS